MNLRVTIIQQFKLFSLNCLLGTGIIDTLHIAELFQGGISTHFIGKEELYGVVLSEAQRNWRENARSGLNDLAGQIRTAMRFLAHKECTTQQSLCFFAFEVA